MMSHIAIISSSVRTGRNSHRVRLFFRNYLESNNIATAEIIDLNEYNFPVFDERLSKLKDPLPEVIEYAERVKNADGIIIVTPEYNGGYPASLKNAIDLLYNEWYRKPIAISTCSDGIFGGTQVITSLQFSLWKIRAWTVPAMFPVVKVQDSFDEKGVPADEGINKRAKLFINELMWCVEARKRMK
jgi:NAD(P)H-dependent FMN reductase